MDVAVTGTAGLLGRGVADACRRRGLQVAEFPRKRLDVSDREAVLGEIAAVRPRTVVHCAAMTDVDACETDPDRAYAVNAAGAGFVAEAAAEVGAEVVGVSTDYVFDGTKGEPYVESDEPNPIQVYGRSKLEGEDGVRSANPRHYVVRSAWIYGRGGKNFLSKLPGLISQGGEISAVTDQRGSPTYAPDLAGAIADLIGSGRYGTYHVVNPGSCTFVEFCRQAVALPGVEATVREITLANLDRPARRPADTTLHGQAWLAAGFEPLPPWQDACKRYLLQSQSAVFRED